VSARIAVAVVAACTAILGGASTATADAAGPPPPTPCTVVYFNLDFGQGVEAFCDQAPRTYQVIAQCADGLSIRQEPGTLATAGEGPSVAECRGGLLSPAYVLSYFIAQ
jgi:hypothetical protein